MASHSEFASCERGVEPLREGHVLPRTGDEDFSFGLMVRRVRRIHCHGGPSGSYVANPIKPKSPSLGKRLTHLDDRCAMQKPWRAHVSEGSSTTFRNRRRHVRSSPDLGRWKCLRQKSATRVVYFARGTQCESLLRCKGPGELRRGMNGRPFWAPTFSLGSCTSMRAKAAVDQLDSVLRTGNLQSGRPTPRKRWLDSMSALLSEPAHQHQRPIAVRQHLRS